MLVTAQPHASSYRDFRDWSDHLPGMRDALPTVMLASVDPRVLDQVLGGVEELRNPTGVYGDGQFFVYQEVPPRSAHPLPRRQPPKPPPPGWPWWKKFLYEAFARH
jgi:hypothetical protein